MTEENRLETGHSNDQGPSANLGAWIAIGVGMGTALGVATDNVALGIGMGVAIGSAIGAGLSRSSSGRDQAAYTSGMFAAFGQAKSSIATRRVAGPRRPLPNQK